MGWLDKLLLKIKAATGLYWVRTSRRLGAAIDVDSIRVPRNFSISSHAVLMTSRRCRSALRCMLPSRVSPIAWLQTLPPAAASNATSQWATNSAIFLTTAQIRTRAAPLSLGRSVETNPMMSCWVASDESRVDERAAFGTPSRDHRGVPTSLGDQHRVASIDNVYRNIWVCRV